MTVKYVAMYELENDSDYLICESLEDALAAANRWAPVVAAVGSEDPFKAVMVFVHDLPEEVWAAIGAGGQIWHDENESARVVRWFVGPAVRSSWLTV